MNIEFRKHTYRGHKIHAVHVNGVHLYWLKRAPYEREYGRPWIMVKSDEKNPLKPHVFAEAAKLPLLKRTVVEQLKEQIGERDEQVG